jgi:hypothetical protein
MSKKELIQKIMKKKEFSDLPKKDVEMAFSKFERRQTSDEEKVKLTRNLLMEVFSAFMSKKLFSSKEREPSWILRKHLSTRERIPYYEEIYKRILDGMEKEISVVDLGAGVNGFSYEYFEKAGFNVDYLAVEAIGQLVRLMNKHFRKNKIKARAVHLSLFEPNKVKREIKKTKKPRIVFLLKTVDSLELMERNYSKKLISEISDLADKIVVSFPTESMIKREKIWVKRTWILKFIEKRFKLLDHFQLGAERYLIFSNK